MPQGVTGGLNDQFFIYDIAFPAMTSGLTSALPLQIDSLSNFLWRAMNFWGYPDGATFSTPFQDNFLRPFTLSITDSATGRSFSNQAVPLDNWAGIGKFSFVLPEPYLWAANSSIQVTLVNLSTVTFDNCHLSLIGKKTFQSFPTP